MLIYRLGSSRYPANDGLGASIYGGRWNRKGTPLIYAAASRALCPLEVLANANELGGDYVVTPIELPDDIGATSLSLDTLPPDWDAAIADTKTADIGTEWAERLETAVLVVPSAIISREHNYILNPRHPSFSNLRFLAPEPFHFDDRLRRWTRSGEA
jgi:RES domain-containing protein